MDISQRGDHGNLTKDDKIAIENVRKKKWKNRAVNGSGASRDSKYSSMNSDTGVEIVDSGVVTNTGHLIVGNNSCSPTMGIFVQAIIGEDFEATMDSLVRTSLDEQVPSCRG